MIQRGNVDEKIHLCPQCYSKDTNAVLKITKKVQGRYL